MVHSIHSTSTQPMASPSMPVPLDCETLALLRGFLAPILETATDWSSLARRLSQKGYGLAFREGHLVILNENGDPLCTGATLGVPLAEIVSRIGRPSIRAHRLGHAGELHLGDRPD